MPSSDGSGSSSTLYLPGLVQNSGYRTNIGLLMSASPAPLTVSVAIDDGDGGTLGTRSFTVQPGVTSHVQFPATSVASATFDAAGAVVRITGGTGTVIAYSSVVDNATGDASYVGGGTAASGAVASMKLLMLRQ